ncbi:MAG: hypothetical protein HZA34_03110 [Candidatus Pacebacteria bacterium]|nr:hypothetical protein [Candidatus Paceibacterota bacterium]
MPTRGEGVFINIHGLHNEDLNRLSTFLAPEEVARVFRLIHGERYEYFSYAMEDTPAVLRALLEETLQRYNKEQYPDLVWEIKESTGVIA